MATEQELFKQYNELRERLERFVPHLVNLLKQIRLVRQSLISDEEKETKAHEAFLFFRTKTKLPSSVSQRNLFDLQTLISDIHEKNGDLESRYVRPELWARFIDQNKNLTTFFQEDNLIQIQPLVFLLTYLNGIEKGLFEQLAQVNERIVREAQVQRAGIAQAAAAISATQQPPPPTTEIKGISETEHREQELAQSQEQRQETLKKAKELYFNHQLEFINSLLPEGRQLRQIDLVNLAKIAADSSFSQLELDALLVRYGVVEALGLADSPDAMAALHEILTSERHSILAQRKLEGLSTNVFPKEATQMQEGVATVSRQLGDRVATHAYSASGRKLKELEKDADGRVDSDIATARRLREESLRALWEKDRGIKRLMGRITGQTKANQYQLLLDLGIITPETEPIKRPRLFEEFLGSVDDRSLTDMFGVPEEIQISGPSEGEISVQPALTPGRPMDPLATKRNLERLKVVGGISKAALANPFVMGGAAVAGVGVYGLVTQGVAGGLGAATSALGGAIAGGLIGSAVGPIGTLVGAVVGALGVGGASLAWQPYGTASAAQMIGQFEGGLVGMKLPISGLTAAAGQGVTGAAAAVSPVAAQGVTQAGVTLNNALSGTSSFLQNLSSIPLASATYAGAAVVGPLVAVGVVTALIITPTLLSVFLVPTPRQFSGEFKGEACWPATGLLLQGPFERPSSSHNHPSGSGWVYLDGIDISNRQINTPLYAPFNGTMSFYTYQQMEGEGGGGNYGNRGVLKTGTATLLFAHMNQFMPEFQPGNSYSVTAGQQVGFMGGSGDAGPNTYGIHLHYEHRPATAAPGPNMEPKVSKLEPLLPEPIQYQDTWMVTRQQIVRSDQCEGKTSTASGQIRQEVKCLQFSDGDKKWTESELALAVSEMTNMMSDARIEKTLCGGGKITLQRNTGTGDSGGAVVDRATISIYDLAFINPIVFGVSTFWHEPGHIIQLRYSPVFVSAPVKSWQFYFPGFSPFIPTYPLGKTVTEDFAEAFGMCSKTRIEGVAGYRDDPTLNYIIEPYFSHQCNAIENMLNAYGQ